MTEIRVDPEKLAGTARAIGQCAEDLDTSLQSLQATITTDNPWGHDEQGSLFGLAYLEVLSHALDVLGSHAGQLGYAAEGLYDWALGAARNDQLAGDQLTAINDSWSG